MDSIKDSPVPPIDSLSDNLIGYLIEVRKIGLGAGTLQFKRDHAADKRLMELLDVVDYLYANRDHTVSFLKKLSEREGAKKHK